MTINRAILICYRMLIYLELKLCPCVDLYLMTINRAILICYRMLIYLELKLCPCDISQLKFSSVSTKPTLLILTQCSYVKNVHMRWETALFSWDRKLTWPSTVWNPSGITARKFGTICPYHIRLEYIWMTLKHWSNHGMARNVNALHVHVNALFVPFTHDQIYSQHRLE